jgi:type I site-specific restriction-modification system R (restriction) subunit
VFIGFTGTPLLKKDKATSLETFGGYIHTYKFSEAVRDEVVLDLVYEARDVDQRLGPEESRVVRPLRRQEKRRGASPRGGLIECHPRRSDDPWRL